MKDESFDFVTGLNIFNIELLCGKKVEARGASRSVKMELGVITNNDGERKWRCGIEFEHISSITSIF